MTAPPKLFRVWALRLCAVVLVLAAAAAAWFGSHKLEARTPPVTHLALLIPDEASADDVNVRVWLEAAAETGFPMTVVRASALMRPGGYATDGALVVPDSVHRRMNDALIAQLDERVRAGAALMLVQDAGVQDMGGNYHPGQSRFSGLAGVRFALYGERKGHMLAQREALVETSAVKLLRLPPGKLMRQTEDSPLTSGQVPPEHDEALSVATYTYGRIRYPAFETRGAYDGMRLMHSVDGDVLAGVRQVGQGQVLFVNLPLGYLKLRTDGFFLHSFLRYFAQNIVALPQLSAMPDARGALIMNWHIDSFKALPAIETLTELGAFTQGPYSVDLTAGPDLDEIGDGEGMDLPHNARMREWVKRFADRGDEVGSHGGWAHNAFGRLVDTQDRALSERMIEQNIQAIEDASGRPVREYSAPIGNHPAWVTRWLHARGINAYYFTGDIGMAPTRAFQDGQPAPEGTWSFPVLSYGRYATLEEAHAAKVPEAEIAAWLKDVADYCATYGTVRLVYFHPPGIALFPDAFKQWMAHTKALVSQQAMRWMTMTQYATFANQRAQAEWQISADTAQGDAGETRGGDGVRIQAPRELLQARHPQSLEHLSWLLPVQRYAQPQVQEGLAHISQEGAYWRVVAGDSKALTLRLTAQNAAQRFSPSGASSTLFNTP